MTPFDLVMQLLEDAHTMLFTLQRQQVADELELGVQPEKVMNRLQLIDETERNYELARAALKELEA